VPYRVGKKRFEEIAAEAVRQIPKKFRLRFRNISVIIEDYPGAEIVRAMGIPRDELMGLFTGQSYGEGESFFSVPSPYPDAIYLFQKNIESVCESEEELREEIRMTVLHEVGHYFGLSEEDLEDFETQ